jgi:Tol biopolymer transport system component
LIRIWMRFAIVIGCVNVFLMLAWITLEHQIQAPLPQILFSDSEGVRSLYLWEADCPSLINSCVHDRRLLQGLNNPFSVAQWSPDGAYIAVYLPDSWAIYPAECLLVDKPCIPWRLDSSANDIRIAWGPDGTTLAYIMDSNSATMKILTRGCWDQSGQRCLKQTVRVASRGVLRQPTWSADGSRFVFLGLQPAGLLRLEAACLDVPDSCTDTGQWIATNTGAVFWPLLSADGSQLLYYGVDTNGTGQLYRADIDNGSTQQLTFQAGGAGTPAWSNDGRYIAFTGFESHSGGHLSIYLLDVERQLIVLAIQRHGADLNYPAWSPRP